MNTAWLAVLVVGICAGCAETASHRAEDLRLQWRRHAIYEVARLPSDSGPNRGEVEQACERILIQMVRDKNELVRLDAASALARFGTTQALYTAISVLGIDRCPEVRAAVARDLCEMLSIEWREKESRGRTEPLATEFRIVTRPPLWRLPPDADASVVEQAIADAFLHDKATYQVEWLDSIRGIPFIRKKGTTVLSVRSVIADALRRDGRRSALIVGTVKLASTSEDREFARQANELLKEWGVEPCAAPNHH